MLMLGMAAAAKLSGIFFLGLGCLLGFFVMLRSVNWWSKRATSYDATAEPGVRVGVKSILMGWGSAYVIVMPWYGFIAYETGNPIWPAFTQLSQRRMGCASRTDSLCGTA